MENETKKPRMVSYSTNGGTATIGDLTKEGVEALQCALAGSKWIAFNGSDVVTADRLAPLPDPIVEPFWGESWQHSNQVDGIKSQHRVTEWGEPHQHRDVSITIQHLCGYGFTPEAYKREARKLQSYGFDCLRSRRGGQGKYWELWYLPGLFLADGHLAEEFKDRKPRYDAPEQEWRQFHDSLVDWFCRNVRFGTLNLTIQRAAAVID